ncbi:MAG: DAK2 domain-containing protein [Oscillospiraceae bacterium]|jgi:hypothetical protein
MIKTIDAAAFCAAVIHGAAAISASTQAVNELNVFPVPDGDTGTNMSMTINTAAAELKGKRYPTVSAAASAVASALLRGARGNSGVILSLLFRGFSKGVKDKETIDGRDFAVALDYGVAAAYKAVMKPAEGTILTVSRLSAAAAAAAARENDAVESVLTETIAKGQEALNNTVNQNPVLKKAGVVDAGGKGFLIILQGMLDSLQGKPMPEAGSEAETQDKADFAALGEEDITFDFDTVFIVRKKKPNVNLDELRAYLNSIGDSLVIGEDDEAFKVHVHTDTPGDALNKAQEFGTLELCKIENMRTQYEDLAAGKHVQSTDDLDAIEKELEGAEEVADAEPEKEIGFVAVCAGDGLAATFKDLGADGVISGGQTMNPSTDDILKQIRKTPARIVYVLPNNKNIIMAAEQCIPLCKEKKVVVIPTKTVPQGISALLAALPEDGEDANTQAMMDAIKGVHTSEVTYAARDSDFDGFDIHQGDYMALSEHQLFGTNTDLDALLKALAEDKPQQEAEFITVIFGADVKQEDAEKAQAIFQAACPNAEVTLLDGGQPVYYYMISAE